MAQSVKIQKLQKHKRFFLPKYVNMNIFLMKLYDLFAFTRQKNRSYFKHSCQKLKKNLTLLNLFKQYVNAHFRKIQQVQPSGQVFKTIDNWPTLSNFYGGLNHLIPHTTPVRRIDDNVFFGSLVKRSSLCLSLGYMLFCKQRNCWCSMATRKPNPLAFKIERMQFVFNMIKATKRVTLYFQSNLYSYILIASPEFSEILEVKLLV